MYFKFKYIKDLGLSDIEEFSLFSEYKFSIIANCSDIPHDAGEMLRKPFDDPYFNYSWDIKFT